VQFVADGPDIPDEIFQDLEDEKLILFCGAGLSMASNLPSFRRASRVGHRTDGSVGSSFGR